MNTINAIRTLENFKKTLRPGCDIDRALSVAISELRKKRYDEQKKVRSQEVTNNDVRRD